MTRFILVATALALMGGAAYAADCPAVQNETMAMDMGGAEFAPPDDAHKALMAGMDEMQNSMMAGGTAADLDVAFICAMMPHHQGAIDMAKAELAYGDDPWAKDLAQKIIDAQTAEIAAMREWVAKQP
jgi:uncharacterized protein (DUF305 family)